MAIDIPEKTRVLVSGKIRYVDDELWESLVGPTPPPNFPNNGCTASPDYVHGFYVWPACVFHDWHYSGQCGVSRRSDADTWFRKNLWRTLRYQGAPWYLAGWLAMSYYIGVTKLGDMAFTPPYDG